MTIYIEKVLIVNFIIDLLLLITVSYVLKRNVSSNRLILGGVIGSLSIIILFIEVNDIILFLYKFIIAIIMCLFTYGFKDIKYLFKNIVYLYIVSLFLGGFFTFLNNSFNTSNVSIIFIMIISPFILYLYYKEMSVYKCNYSNYYNVKLFLKGGFINVCGFLDSGNKLCDPYLNRPVILLNKVLFKDDINLYRYFMVPYVTASGKSLLTCILVDKIEIDGVGIKKNVLVGLIDNNIHIDNIDLILNTKLLEEINV